MRDVVEVLSSGLIDGIGRCLAMKIYNRYGDKSLEVIENNPDALTQIKGVSSKTVASIKQSLDKNKELIEILHFLYPFNITVAQMKRLYNIYGKSTIRVIKQNPYVLLKLNIDFDEVDDIALNQGTTEDSDNRLEAVFNHIMTSVWSEGSTGIERDKYLDKVIQYVGDDYFDSIISKYKELLHFDRYRQYDLGDESTHRYTVFSRKVFDRELETSRRIDAIVRDKIVPILDIDTRLGEYECKKGIKLDTEQITAVKTTLQETMTVITGGPGAGKTTIIDAIIDIYERATNKSAILLAPTGKAARRLEELTNHQTSTIHSYFKAYEVQDEVECVIDTKVTDTLVIIDEASMINSAVGRLLFTHLQDRVRVVIVGDIDQLQPVGSGAVMRDIINSEICSVVRLKTIHRALLQSCIYVNTQKVKTGDTKLKKGDDFHIYRRDNWDNCKCLIGEIYQRRVNQYGMDQCIVLLPHREEYGVGEINAYIQDIINPSNDDKVEVLVGEKIFRVGDMIMHVNSNTPEVVNGDTGRIVDIENTKNSVRIICDILGKCIIYEKENLRNLCLAYAITVHKAQGSEYKSVICCITMDHSAMLYRNIPYVAFSRSKVEVDLICDRAIDKAIKKENLKRITLLAHLLKKMKDDEEKI